MRRARIRAATDEHGARNYRSRGRLRLIVPQWQQKHATDPNAAWVRPLTSTDRLASSRLEQESRVHEERQARDH